MSKHHSLIDALAYAKQTGGIGLTASVADLDALLADLERAEKALAAITKQAQPVANDRDCPHCNYTGSMHCGDVAKTHGGILNPEDCSHAKLFGSRITTPPAPQPAPVDELIEALEDLMDWQVKNVKSWHNRAYDRAHFVIEKHRAALQSPAPQTKGQP